jgi:hypothetical protein
MAWAVLITSFAFVMLIKNCMVVLSKYWFQWGVHWYAPQGIPLESAKYFDVVLQHGQLVIYLAQFSKRWRVVIRVSSKLMQFVVQGGDPFFGYCGSNIFGVCVVHG